MPKMTRKRKVPVCSENLSTNNNGTTEVSAISNSSMQHGPMYNIMSHAQINETFHNKYLKEMQQLYEKMDHDAFMYTFINMLKSTMVAEESNEYANITLIFCAKYVTSYNTENTHPVLVSIFKWLLSTISTNPHIRYRICQFVNMVLNALGVEAALDDCICDSIMCYMIARLRDLNPNIRVQAILALQRLQIPDNPDDLIVKTYQFHLSCDPSPRVRQAVITSMGRNYNTIPYILERLWDVDEKVRRHTYLHMSSYPAKAYKVSQRLTLLEQGLNDRSEMVRKVVNTVMLPQWLESYNKNFISLISALKLDANELEIDRFRKITKVMLREIFKRQEIEDLIIILPLETEEQFQKCVPFDKLSVEITMYWLCLIEFLQNEMADEIDAIIPELSTFCAYVLKYCESFNYDMDKWQRMEYQYVLLTLMEIIYTFDLGDEIGRENLKQLLTTLLKNFNIEEHTIEMIVKCAENLITANEDRLQFFVDIIKEITELKSWRRGDLTNDRTLLEELLEKHPDKSLKLKLSSLKVKILDLEEQEMNFVQKKDYVKAHQIADDRNATTEEYTNVLQPLMNQLSKSGSDERSKSLSSFPQVKKVTVETIVKCLQIAFYMVASKKIKSLTPNVCELYKDFIRRHIESNQIIVRDWALKCGTAYSLLYDQLSKDVYSELYSQFYKNHNPRLWTTSIDCIFELLDRYGFSHFEIEDKQNKSRKPCRQLYTTLEFTDAEEDTTSSAAYGIDLIFMMSHFLDTCDDVSIIRALINGFCRLVLHGHIKNDDIVEKLLLKYFNPITEPEINQILGVFFENLIKKKKQEYLQSSLLPTISTILSAPYDSPLHEIKPESVLRFVIDSTRPVFCSPGLNIHNTVALSFMQEMQNNVSNKELLKILSKELYTLELSVTDDGPLRNDLKNCCEKLLQCELEIKAAKNISNFKEMLEGNYKHNNLNDKQNPGGSDEENLDEASEDEDENRNKNDSKNDENIGITQLNKSKDVMLEETNGNITIPETPEKENLDNSKNLSKKSNSPSPPTTFGKDNTTSLRYLRKSLNIRQKDVAPPKQNKTITLPVSSKKLKVNQQNVKFNEKTITSPAKRKSLESENSDIEKDNNNDENLIINEKSILANNTTNEESVHSIERTGDQSQVETENEDDEVIPLSQNIPIKLNNKSKKMEIGKIESSDKIRKPAISIEKKAPLTRSASKSSETSNSGNANNVKGKRSLNSTQSTQSKAGDDYIYSPLSKLSRCSVDISEKSNSNKNQSDKQTKGVMKTPIKKSDVNEEKSKNSKNTRIILTDSAIKRITRSKHPLVKLKQQCIQADNHRNTRSTSKQKYVLNNVLTRKRLAMENEIISSSRQTDSSQEQQSKDKATVVKDKEKDVSSTQNKLSSSDKAQTSPTNQQLKTKERVSQIPRKMATTVMTRNQKSTTRTYANSKK